MATQPQPPRREAPPSTTGDPLKDQWEQLRPQLHSWWDRLTEADLMQIDGQKDRLISIVQQRYGYPRERAQQEVERRLQEYGGRTAGVAATVTSAAQGVASSVTETVGTAATKAQEMAGSAATKAQEMAGSAATVVTDTAAGVGTYVQEKGLQGLSEDLTQLIRRYPVPALLVGLGIGFVLARTIGTRQTAPGS
jgi:uncharacterized protein YjbJ (UPF0337 family)